MTVRDRRAGALVAWIVLLGTAAAALHLAGGSLPSPPLHSPSRWPGWLSGRDPIIVAFSALRLLALGFAWYALVVTVAGALARLRATADLAAGLDRLTLPPLRRVLAATMSVGISTAPLAPAAGGAAARPAPAVVAAQSPTTTTAPPADSLTMRELPPPAEEAAPSGRTWTVRPGECFWSIAEEVLTPTLGRRPTATEVVPYWRSLVDANRAALADRENPDLVFPGQVFSLPDPGRT